MLPRLLVHCTLYTVHCTLYSVICVLRIVNHQANCELNQADLEGSLFGGEAENPEQKYGLVTEEEQKTFLKYDWNTNVADIRAGKRQQLKSVMSSRRCVWWFASGDTNAV